MYFLRYVWTWQPFNNTHYSAEFENHLFSLGSFLIGQSWNGSISILAFTKKLADFFLSFHIIPFLPRIQHNQKTLRLTKKLLDKPFLSFFGGVGGH